MNELEAALVSEAIAEYNLTAPSVEFPRHNENITCRVSDGDKKYVLRIKRPRDGFSLTIFGDFSPSMLAESEIALLRHLGKHADFAVQTPICTKRGDDVCILSDGSPACLLSWLDGNPLDKATASDRAFELGVLAARLHKAAEGFDCARLNYNASLVENMRAKLDNAAGLSHITPDENKICDAALDEISRVMSILDREENSTAYIHADMGFGNIILSDGLLSPIDFSLSGYGYRAAECGMLASNFNTDDDYKAIRDGYESVSGIKIDPHTQKAFLAMSILLFISAQHSRVRGEDWFRGAMKRLCGGVLGNLGDLGTKGTGRRALS